MVVFLAWVAWRLGEWQFHRLDDRKERNAIIERNEQAGADPVDRRAGARPGRRRSTTSGAIVEATGTYAVEDTVVVRYRTRDGAAGVDVVVPLELADGTSVLVDRGWFATDNRGADAGRRARAAGRRGHRHRLGAPRRRGRQHRGHRPVHPRRQQRADRRGAGPRGASAAGVDLRSESPEPETPLLPVELPELDNGPHFFYGLQWWFFGALAIFGFFYLMYDECARRPRARSAGETARIRGCGAARRRPGA